jgi:hypothetical protein
MHIHMYIQTYMHTIKELEGLVSEVYAYAHTSIYARTHTHTHARACA